LSPRQEETRRRGTGPAGTATGPAEGTPGAEPGPAGEDPCRAEGRPGPAGSVHEPDHGGGEGVGSRLEKGGDGSRREL